MKTTFNETKLFALVLLGTAAIIGCSSFKSPTAGYVKPGELCTDVSQLPDPNAPPPAPDQTDPLRKLQNQYGVGGRRDESPERLLMQADSYFEQKRYHDSARLYKKYLAIADLSNASPELLGLIHYRIGYVANKKTFYSEAKDEYIQALQFSPLSDEFLFAYAKVCYESQDYQTADQQFTILLQRSPNYPEAQRYYGLTLLEGSNRAYALQPLTTALGALEAYTLLTDKYYEVGELELAAQMEAQTIQIAAQEAKPIPNFPHKEQMLANAQNATYAQALNNVGTAQHANVGVNAPLPAAPGAPQTAPVAPQQTMPVAQQQTAPVAPQQTMPVAQQQTAPVALQQTMPVAQQQIAPVTPQQTMPVAQQQIAPVTPQQTMPVAQQYTREVPGGPQTGNATASNQVAPQSEQPIQVAMAPVETTAPVAQPQQTAAPQNVASVPATAEPTLAPTVPMPAPHAPITESNAGGELGPSVAEPQAPIRYSEVAPVVTPPETPPAVQGPVLDLNSAAAQQPLQSLGNEPVQGPMPNYAIPNFDDEDDWDDADFATSGYPSESYAPAPDVPIQPYVEPMRQQVPQSQVPQYQFEGYNPQSFGEEPQFQRYQPQVQAPSFSHTTTPEEAFNLALVQLDALEEVERAADDARKLVRHTADLLVTADHDSKFEFVGYVAKIPARYASVSPDVPKSVEIQALASDEPEDVEVVPEASGVVATELPPTVETSSEPSSESAKTPAPSTTNTGKKRAPIKATVHIGNGNPGLFVTTAASRNQRDVTPFRPGSIETSDDVDQSRPDEIAVRVTQGVKRRVTAEDLANAAKKREERWIQAQRVADALFEGYDFIDQNSLAFYEPIKVYDPDDWDDAEFATSGYMPEPIATGGFGDYMVPESAYVAMDPESVRPGIAAALPQSSGIPSPPDYAQSAPVAPQNQQQYQLPAQTHVPRQGQAGRAQLSAEEKLEAARRAGAQVVELSPDEYRQAVANGLRQNPR
ncbi:MAG: hypothetical protein ACOX0A_05825 [Thermoguttaceae bacterium]|jgi:tetratricopeptide (TPR) repeat protein